MKSYRIWCQVSGGITGSREAYLKENNEIFETDNKVEAMLKASALQTTVRMTDASFNYTVEERDIEDNKKQNKGHKMKKNIGKQVKIIRGTMLAELDKDLVGNTGIIRKCEKMNSGGAVLYSVRMHSKPTGRLFRFWEDEVEIIETEANKMRTASKEASKKLTFSVPTKSFYKGDKMKKAEKEKLAAAKKAAAEKAASKDFKTAKRKTDLDFIGKEWKQNTKVQNIFLLVKDAGKKGITKADFFKKAKELSAPDYMTKAMWKSIATRELATIKDDKMTIK